MRFNPVNQSHRSVPSAGAGQRAGDGAAAGSERAARGCDGLPEAVQGILRLLRDPVPESHPGGRGARHAGVHAGHARLARGASGACGRAYVVVLFPLLFFYLVVFLV